MLCLSQWGNGSPVEGMYRFIRLLMDKFGLSESNIDLITKKNPAASVGVYLLLMDFPQYNA